MRAVSLPPYPDIGAGPSSVSTPKPTLARRPLQAPSELGTREIAEKPMRPGVRSKDVETTGTRCCGGQVGRSLAGARSRCAAP